MSISQSDVRHVALLARLALTDEQVVSLQTELNSILGHIDELQGLDLADVQPTAHALEVTNSVRPDVVKPCLPRELALLNAPEAEDGAFVIPAIVGTGEDA